ncbi:MAG: transposase [Elusimicrobiales bacterium]|nr:transposase [Elusimicrobiales bacterium]
MKTTHKYTLEEKVAIVQEWLQFGADLDELCWNYSLPKRTVKQWRTMLEHSGHIVAESQLLRLRRELTELKAIVGTKAKVVSILEKALSNWIKLPNKTTKRIHDHL